MRIIKFFSFVFIYLLCLSCINKKEISKFKFSWDTLILDTNTNKLLKVNDSQIIYEQNNSVLLERNIYANNDEKIAYFEYNFFNISDSIGKKYGSRIIGDTLIFIDDIKVIDIKKKYMMYDFSVQDITNPDHYKLIKKSDVISNKQYNEHYILKKVIDDTYPDSIVISYNNEIEKYPFSLSTILEEKRKTRVQKIHIFFKEHKGIKFSKSREFIFLVEKMSMSDQESVENLFKRFEKDINKK